MHRLVLAFVLTAAAALAPLTAQTSPNVTPTSLPASAQAPRAESPQGQSPTPAPAPAAPSRPPSLSGPTLNGVNIRLDITITDTFDNTPQKKTVSMTILSGQTGMVRTQNTIARRYPVRLNVDAMATAYANGLISTRLSVNYLPAPRSVDTRDTGLSGDSFPDGPGQLEESLAVVLTDGQPLVLTESADPMSTRKVTLEVKATVLK